jgi:hypothetical protein
MGSFCWDESRRTPVNKLPELMSRRQNAIIDAWLRKRFREHLASG